MANYLDTAVRVVPVESEEYLVMREDVALLNSYSFGSPSSLDDIIVL